MKKKITAMLLAICCISSTCTVYADDSTSAGDISAMASEIVAQAAVRAEEYQELKKEAKKYADAQEVERRAQEIKEETARIRKEALEEAARQKEAKRVAKRKEVADFAVQFVGNPYVWGGTSLTNGADCSGFVMSVFANFGYKLPRVAAAQYQASQQKEISQMEVGDLVFYGAGIYHVALYIGNGKVVHALNANKGIVITDYDYETPTGVGTYME
nr:NlpC/P60 family protein [uncultured Blautia sp.]